MGEVFLKQCRKSHNPLVGCATLRLGTLYSFRKHENPALVDGGEGLFDYRLLSPRGEGFGPKFLGSLLQNSGMQIYDAKPLRVPGSFEVHVGSLRTEEGKKFDADVFIKYSAPDSFIFCMSRAKHVTLGTFPGYDSGWLLPSNSLHDVLGVLVHLLNWAQLEQNFLQLSGDWVSKLQWHGCYHLVRYGSRSVKIEDESRWPASRLERLLRFSPFRKPERYFREAELRFQVLPIFERRLIPIPVSYVDVDAKLFAESLPISLAQHQA